LKLAKDCQIIGTTVVTEADTYVAYTAEVKRKERVGIKRMNYNDFLTALMKLSTKVRGSAGSSSRRGSVTGGAFWIPRTPLPKTACCAAPDAAAAVTATLAISIPLAGVSG
jgi:hypothetical protein